VKEIQQSGDITEIGDNGMKRDSSDRKPRYDLIPAAFHSMVQDYVFEDTDVDLYNISNKLFQVNKDSTIEFLGKLLGNIIQYDIYKNRNGDLVDYTNDNILHYWESLAFRLSDGAKYYGTNNWKKARGAEEYERFIESFVRHSFEVLINSTSEENVSGAMFNLMGIHYMRENGFMDSEKECVVNLYPKSSVCKEGVKYTEYKTIDPFVTEDD